MNNKKSVFVLLIGETNAGKSTLVNAIVDSKVSIVSHKVQTTRFKVLGIHTEGESQIIFIDTPGIFNPKRDFDREMLNISFSQMEEADIIAVIVDSQKGISNHTQEIIKKIPANKKAIFIFNKVDLIKKEKLLDLLKQVEDSHNFERFFMVSALKKNGLKDIVNYLANNTVHDNWFYDEDQISDLPLNQLATEITREKIYKHLHQELPYHIAVVHDKWEETDSLITIYQTVFVAKANYKGMVLGRSGEKIKQIRLETMNELQKEFGKKVNLYLYVKVDEKIFQKMLNQY
ncbi:MAG: GTPase Era [Alphaproteobacteria bacterium]|jgi:GTP-binding protein Era|nr:GTPase Era [Alphaproteobacteria bacterium]